MGLFNGIFTYLVKAPLSGLYGLGVYIRNKLYNWKVFKSISFDIPIINVGNITVGGTGKTPHIEYILSILAGKYKVATLSRGYKRKSKGFRYVQDTDTAITVGDEPLQVKQKYPLVTVAVDADRVAGINKLINEIDLLQIVLLDDAFQHRRVKPNLNIVLIDYNRPLYNDKLLPWGNLRDTKSQLCRAEVVVITKCPDDLQPIDLRMITKYTNLRPYQQLYFTTLQYGAKTPVFDNTEFVDTLLQGEGTIVIAGVASPQPFVNYVRKNFGAVTTILFADHHAFTKSDIKHICEASSKAAIILTTEKDSVRLRQWSTLIPPQIKAKLFYIPIKVRFLKDEDKFIKQIFDYVRTNKSNSRLY